MKLLFNITTLGSLIFVLIATSCKKNEISSIWRDGEIIIDGDSGEWTQDLVYNEDNNISFGIRNDAEALYMCLVTSDRELVRKIVGNGLIIWLDSDGGKDRSFGIKYPVGMIGRGASAREFMGAKRDPNNRLNDDQFDLLFEQQFTELQVLAQKGKEKNMYALKEAKEKGLEVKASMKNGILIYEAKTPFNFDGGIAAISLDSSNPVGVGLETPNIDLAEIRKNRSRDSSAMGGADSEGGMSGGRRGGGGRGGMGGGRGGGMGGRQEMNTSSPVKIWTTVALAEAQ